MNDSVHTAFVFRVSAFLQLFPVQEGIHHAEEDECRRQGCCPDGPVKECADNEECQADNDGRQVQLVRTGALVIGIVDFTDHEKGQDEHADHSQPVPNFGAGKNVGCHNDAGHRAGQSFEITVNACHLHVEPGQPEGTECTQQGAGNKTDGSQFMELVSVHEGPRSDAEEISSDRESSSTPMGPAVCSARATRPSRASATMAIRMNTAAVLKFPDMDIIIDSPPKNAFAAVTVFATHDLFTYFSLPTTVSPPFTLSPFLTRMSQSPGI